MLRILLVGGGTGGHIYPLVAVAQELKNQAAQAGTDLKLQFIGDNGLLRQLAQEQGTKFRAVLSSKWRRYFSFLNLLDALKFPLGFFQALFCVWLFMPDVIFAKGGYASFLPALAGKIFAIPIVIHESDSIPGRVNTFLGKMARKIFLSFEFSKQFFNGTKCETVGNPIRKDLFAGPDKKTALAAFGLNPDKPAVLIIGGSQGSKAINDVLALAVVELARKFQIIHQSGAKNFEEVSKQILDVIKEGKTLYGQDIERNYRVYPTLDLAQLALAYSASDVVVSRAGSQIFEIAALGKPAIVIPLKGSAADHQLSNAREFAKFGATVIEEANLTPHILINEIEKAFENRTELSQKIKQFARPDAASLIARKLMEMT